MALLFAITLFFFPSPSHVSCASAAQAIGSDVDPLEIFQHFDTDNSGAIDLKEFNDGLERLGIFLTKLEIAALLEKFGVKSGGAGIVYSDFVRALGLDSDGGGKGSERDGGGNKEGGKAHVSFGPSPAEPSAASAAAGDGGGGFATAAAPKEVHQFTQEEFIAMANKVHSEMNRLARKKGGEKPQFKKVFRKMDKDGGGALDTAEFIDGLATMGFVHRGGGNLSAVR